MTAARPTPGETAELEALVALAARQQSAGRLAEAAAAYRQIVLLRPDIAEAHNNLGNVLTAQRQLDEAASHYQRAVALNPALFQAHSNLGNIYRQRGQFAEAVAHYEQAIALQPDLFEPHFALGRIFQRQGQFDRAVASVRRAIALKPDHAQSYHTLGNLFFEQEKLSQAREAFQHAVTLDSGYCQAHNMLGCVLEKQEQFDLALASYRRALAIDPGYADAWFNLGNALKQLGKFDEAVAHYDQALTLKPDFAQAHHSRSDLKTFRAGDADLAALESLAADADRLPPDQMPFVHFALAKALEDVGDYRRAFEHLLKGNALRRREVEYDAATGKNTLRLIAKVFEPGLFERFATAGDPSPAPVFIVGMPRSGSTLVEQILASHPQVQAAGELENLRHVLEAMSNSGDQPVYFPQCIQSFDANGMRRLGQAYLASLPALAEGKTRITDKLPGNFLFVGLIRLILPNARIIHTVRDPVDTCVSCFSKSFALSQAFSYDLAELGAFYRGYHQLMAHWRSVLPAGAMLDVAYEDVVERLEEQARRLIDFCGLPWDDRCLNFHQSSRPIATASNVQVRRPIYRNSLARWRRYEALLGPLLAELDGLPRQ
ncbi:MAG TPA: tetratricopeptide repeat protein [Pirellulales bacterium]